MIIYKHDQCTLVSTDILQTIGFAVGSRRGKTFRFPTKITNRGHCNHDLISDRTSHGTNIFTINLGFLGGTTFKDGRTRDKYICTGLSHHRCRF